jgi:accessory gene regulator B
MTALYGDTEMDNDRKEIIRYGLELTIMKIIFTACAFGIALLLGEPISYLLFTAVFIPVRSLAGGYHASTHAHCFIESMGVVVLVCALMKLFDLNSAVFTVAGLVFAAVSAVVLWIISPVEHENRPLPFDKKKKFKKQVRVYILIFSAVLITLFVLNLTRFALPIETALTVSAVLALLGLKKNHAAI